MLYNSVYFDPLMGYSVYFLLFLIFLLIPFYIDPYAALLLISICFTVLGSHFVSFFNFYPLILLSVVLV